MGGLEGDFDVIVAVAVAVVVADDVQPFRLPQAKAVVQHLVAHVPGVDFPLVPGDDGGDVLFHPLDEHLGADLVALVIQEKPLWALGVPHQRVATHCLAVGLAVLHQLVGGLKVIHILLGVDVLGLGAVLQGKDVELLVDNLVPVRSLLQVPGLMAAPTWK